MIYRLEIRIVLEWLVGEAAHNLHRAWLWLDRVEIALRHELAAAMRA